MRELFEAIGPPRNYDPSAQDGRHQEGGEDVDGSLSLWEERQREKKKQRAENAEKWVGATAAPGVPSGWGPDGEAASALEMEGAIEALREGRSRKKKTAIVLACFSGTKQIYLV